ncbi:MAG: glutamine-hydrolyzing carbamoyl-phosphate synthase small subunit [Acidimicrobiia bacterium]|nr:glutamine-hydrolyzing carbamoyl-phosphate synthase small subunit [Acidimicrobiia bacterium]
MTSNSRLQDSVLIFADGTQFEGSACGYIPENGVASGEVVFNTSISGYQEIISDPSYAGQIITFTATQIGNYGTNSQDNESEKPFCNGVVIRDLARKYSNWRANATLDTYLQRNQIPGICNVDTRALTRFIRDNGSLPAAFGTDEQTVKKASLDALSTDGQNVAAQVSTKKPYFSGTKDMPFYVVAYDFGIKSSIIENLNSRGIYVEVVPHDTSAQEVFGRAPDGVFLSNGPGDPDAVTGARETVKQFIGELPLFGICLGHQILGLALNATTTKLEFGHHGGNHPVKNILTNEIEITSQNHNYVVEADSIKNAQITHINLNDQTVEGLRLDDGLTFSVQHHPEASPGPTEAQKMFDVFRDTLEKFEN